MNENARRSTGDITTRSEKAMHGRVPLASQAGRQALGEIGNKLGPTTARVAGKEAAVKENASESLSDMSTLLNNFREKTQRAGLNAGVTKWGRTSQRTSTYKPRDISNATGGTMTTRTGEPASKRESYTSYLQGRAAEEKPDIDALDRENPLAVTEYVNDIFNYWFRVEPDTQVAPNYMLIQTDINDKMRAILIDWLVEVHLKFKLMPETLFLTHNLIDRFLSKKVVTRKNLQLVGVTAMLLASKYEEIWAPEVRDFVYISDKAYTREQILGMEKEMLNTLGFHLTVPTPYQFMSRFFKAANADKQFQLLASFIVESSLPDYSMLKYPGSLLAASAVYVAMRTLDKGEWNETMEAHTRYTEEDIMPCANAMARLQRKSATASLSAVHKKYSNPKFMEVARLVAPEGLGEDSA
mmetsp:Transcript_10312/g.25263  ORF Transcript_10312/g.25263 Transcript_10312/m.25263 type:complete len:412 (+) Transcript_10312:73-1308(+)|eukprot:CAMPEP_0197578224 /NCGR_PEP_ID=MMETSP1326-20131121/2537_1 /TAXON_ID=1155430 /ORGANISM="Genus nov. species nov., Strain RCC2288" /LENGTH=411 /DNA_ID=CAMNT_0043141391 /DNA_START=73 /DNA_END=1308 /DNA_ORIENTATION=+